MLERAVAGLTGVTTYTAGTIVATTAAGGAAIVFERLLAARIGERRACGRWRSSSPRASPRELGTTIRAYSLAHVLYLAAVFLPQFSLSRLLGATALQPAGVVLLWILSYP